MTIKVKDQPVGLVIGTKASSPLEFWVGVNEDQYLQLDDVVVVRSKLPSEEEIVFYGIVDSVEKELDGLEFHSDNQLVHQGILPTALSHIAKVFITRIEPEFFVPPHPGMAVYRAFNQDFDNALFFDKMEYVIPAGVMRNGQTALINYEFINGTKGAHISISGISGVATKTSYALFLLHGIFNSPTLDNRMKNNARALIFNVKGEDLFFLDKSNARLSSEDRNMYQQLNLPTTPFQDVHFYAPCQSHGGELVPNVSTRSEGVQAYGWTLWDIADQGLFSFLFAEDSQSMSNLNYVIDRVSNQLYILSRDSAKPRISDITNTHLYTLKDLKNHWQKMLDEEDDYKEDLNRWFGKNTAPGTISAFMRRFEAASSHVSGLIRPDIEEDNHVQWQNQKVSLVDINKLHSRAKMFVVGAILRNLFKEKERQGHQHSTIFIVLDELNRYAPRQGWSPIKDILLDIAERGRSMGIVLIGAQQTASEIERRIVSNAAIRVNGRLDAAEASHKEYDHLTGTFKKRSLMIKPGTMIAYQPELPSPVLVNYPFAAWATRKSEVAQSADSSSSRKNPFDAFK